MSRAVTAPSPAAAPIRTVKHRFRMIALPSERFDDLRAMSEPELRARGVLRMRADEKPGFPCRVSLVDAEIGEEVLLMSFTHHDVDTPYRASGPIFVRVAATTARPEVNEVPALIRSRLHSIRAYDGRGMMLASQVAEGRDIEEHIGRFFDDARVEYLHLHNARPGCFNCRVERV